MISHRGISVITPLPFGGGVGGGASDPQNASGIQNSQNVTANEDTNKKVKSSLHPAYRGISVITPLPLGEGKGEGPAGVGGGANFLLIIFSFREKAEYATRGGPSTSENMPFLHVEDALLDARRACSQFVFVTL